jgi:hypothetical protein
VFARDRGVCALCGLDTEALRRARRKLDYAARRRFEKDWGSRNHLWDADHIVAVAEGGGECDLSNMRTLCLKCHRQVTADLRMRLRTRTSPPDRSETPVGTAGASPIPEVYMPGKKAHKPRENNEAAQAPIHGSGKARKSAAQTQGHYERDIKRRLGQYGGAGDPPLIKK